MPTEREGDIQRLPTTGSAVRPTAKESGFYWARRKDDGQLTVIELLAAGGGEPYFQLIGNLGLPLQSEVDEIFDILERIAPPVNKQTK